VGEYGRVAFMEGNRRRKELRIGHLRSPACAVLMHWIATADVVYVSLENLEVVACRSFMLWAASRELCDGPNDCVTALYSDDVMIDVHFDEFAYISTSEKADDMCGKQPVSSRRRRPC
jgi:hypothetical protein